MNAPGVCDNCGGPRSRRGGSSLNLCRACWRERVKGRPSYFPDDDLIVYTRQTYGPAMAEKLSEILALDPENETGFANSIRRSLTHEIERGGSRG